MANVQLATRVDARVKAAVEECCRSRGVTMSRFIQEALLDKIEELRDAEDVPALLAEPTRPLADIARDLGLDEAL